MQGKKRRIKCRFMHRSGKECVRGGEGVVQQVKNERVFNFSVFLPFLFILSALSFSSLSFRFLSLCMFVFVSFSCSSFPFLFSSSSFSSSACVAVLCCCRSPAVRCDGCAVCCGAFMFPRKRKSPAAFLAEGFLSVRFISFARLYHITSNSLTQYGQHRTL